MPEKLYLGMLSFKLQKIKDKEKDLERRLGWTYLSRKEDENYIQLLQASKK